MALELEVHLVELEQGGLNLFFAYFCFESVAINLLCCHRGPWYICLLPSFIGGKLIFSSHGFGNLVPYANTRDFLWRGLWMEAGKWQLIFSPGENTFLALELSLRSYSFKELELDFKTPQCLRLQSQFSLFRNKVRNVVFVTEWNPFLGCVRSSYRK